MLILDEADRILELNKFELIKEAIKIIQSKNNNIQNILLSATLTSSVRQLSNFFLKEDFIEVGINSKELVENKSEINSSSKFKIPSNINQLYAIVPEKYKSLYLMAFIRNNIDERLLIFF